MKQKKNREKNIIEKINSRVKIVINETALKIKLQHFLEVVIREKKLRKLRNKKKTFF